jgi:hypothetical protein
VIEDTLIQTKIVYGDSPDDLQDKLGKFVMKGWTPVGELFNATIQTHTYETKTTWGHVRGSHVGFFSGGSMSGEIPSSVVKPTEHTTERYCQRVVNGGTPLKDDDKLEWESERIVTNDEVPMIIVKGRVRGVVLYEAVIPCLNGVAPDETCFFSQGMFQTFYDNIRTDVAGAISNALNVINKNVLRFIYSGHDSLEIMDEKTVKRAKVLRSYASDFNSQYVFLGEPFEETFEKLSKEAAEKHFEELKKDMI